MMADLATLLFPEPGGPVWRMHRELERQAALEVQFGAPGAPYRCLVCGEQPALWRRDERGLLFDHAGRRYPCRIGGL